MMDLNTAMEKILKKSERSEKVLLTEREFLKSTIGIIVEMAPNRNPRNLEKIVVQARDNFRKYANNDNEWYSLRIAPKRMVDLVSALLSFDDFMRLNLTQNEIDRGVTDPNRSKYKFSSLYDVETSESWRDDFIDLDACIRNIASDISFNIEMSDDCFGCTNKGYGCVDCINRENLKNNYRGNRKPKGNYTMSCKYDCYKSRYICCHECPDTCEHRCTLDVDKCGKLAEDNRKIELRCRDRATSSCEECEAKREDTEKSVADTVIGIIFDATRGGKGAECNGEG